MHPSPLPRCSQVGNSRSDLADPGGLAPADSFKCEDCASPEMSFRRGVRLSTKLIAYLSSPATGSMPFVQSCVLCGDHKRFMHDPGLTGCPTCGAPYCRNCYRSLPKVKVGLLRKEVQCPRCAQASAAARAPFSPTPYAQPSAGHHSGQGGYSPPPPVVVNVHQLPPPPPPPPPAVYLHCTHCGSLAQAGATRCASCGGRL